MKNRLVASVVLASALLAAPVAQAQDMGSMIGGLVMGALGGNNGGIFGQQNRGYGYGQNQGYGGYGQGYGYPQNQGYGAYGQASYGRCRVVAMRGFDDYGNPAMVRRRICE